MLLLFAVQVDGCLLEVSLDRFDRLEPRYRNKPISTVNALARVLEISTVSLIQLTHVAESLYHPNAPVPKSDGTFRQHYRVDDRLKSVQKKINLVLFGNTDFPTYLKGGISDPQSPRDYVSDANTHVGQRLIITEDIKDLFPSVRASLVCRMWQHLYCFPPEIARILATLTTYHDMLPQGAPTSTYIANLIFWQHEPQLVARLQEMGFKYTRYVDNVSISTNLSCARETIGEVTSLLYGMFNRLGLSPKRRKRATFSQRGPIVIHQLNLNAGRPTLPKSTRETIRFEIWKFERKLELLTPSEQLEEFQRLTA